VDGDIVGYRCAASAEKDDLVIAIIRADRLLKDVISVTGSDEYKLFLSGSNNFRKEIYPEYKANRKDMVRPKHLEAVREYLVLEWNGNVTDGYEADDAIGIAAQSENTVICSIDKDLKQLPGTHYNFVTGEFTHVGIREGWCNFYKQLILGDRGDNVPGYDGKMRVKFPKFLESTRQQLDGAVDPYDMYQICLAMYDGDESRLIRNARLLYLWRKDQDEFQKPLTPTSVASPEEVQKLESTLTTGVEIIPSTEHGTTKLSNAGYPARGRRKATVKVRKRRVASTLTSGR
jgi:hypothetical protein